MKIRGSSLQTKDLEEKMRYRNHLLLTNPTAALKVCGGFKGYKKDTLRVLGHVEGHAGVLKSKMITLA